MTYLTRTVKRPCRRAAGVSTGRLAAGIVAACLAAAMVLSGFYGAATPARAQTPPVDQSRPQESRITGTNPATGYARFMRVGAGRPVTGGEMVQAAGINATEWVDRSLTFLGEEGAAFGITDPAAQLVLQSVSRDVYGSYHVTFSQRHAGLPVYGAQLIVHLDGNGAVYAVNGTFVPGIHVSPQPALDAETAHVLAAEGYRHEQKQGIGMTPAAVEAELVLYHRGLVYGKPGDSRLAYAVRVQTPTGPGLAGVDATVMVDARNGAILEQIDHLHSAIWRILYNQGQIVWQEGNALPYSGAGADDINAVINYTKDTYNFFYTLSNGVFDSWNGWGAALRAHLVEGLGCPNASWNGQNTAFCPGVAADDIVAHEWSHAYTGSTHGLIYLWQSGALNEAYADIWGETVDLVNTSGTDTPNALRKDGGCSIYGSGTNQTDGSVRWLVGEDSNAFGGAIRDLWNPNCYGDPGHVSDPRYWCSEGDSGGVHINSNVAAHAYALLVDGGAYGGQSVSGVGLTKAAHIYWRAQTVYQTPVSDFADHADALEQSCRDLVGQHLSALSTKNSKVTPADETITDQDCAQVAAAVAAVELRTPPDQCNFAPILDAESPPLCPVGETATPIHVTDWEAGLAEWQVARGEIADIYSFDGTDWQVVADLPDGRAGQAAFVANDPTLGDCGYDDESGVLYLQSPTIAVPDDERALLLAFDHWFALEEGWDGGVVELSVNGDDWQSIRPEDFVHNGYPGRLRGSSEGNSNPLEDRPAFTGANQGSTRGLWAQSRVDLYEQIRPGDTLRMRFSLGLDGCNGMRGWYVDTVQLYSCQDPTAPTPTPTTITPSPTPTLPPSSPPASATPAPPPTETATPAPTATDAPTPTQEPPSVPTTMPTATSRPAPTAQPTTTPSPTEPAPQSPVPTPTEQPDGILRGVLFYDYLGNSQLDVEDILLTNRRLTLTWAGPDNQLGTGDDQTLTGVSDAQGRYVFAGLPPGRFRLRVGAPVGSVQAGMVDQSDDLAVVVDLDEHEQQSSEPVAVTGQDFDNDTLSDEEEGATDLDGDGLPNYADEDADGDQIPDRLEGRIDRDGNGKPDFLDPQLRLHLPWVAHNG